MHLYWSLVAQGKVIRFDACGFWKIKNKKKGTGMLPDFVRIFATTCSTVVYVLAACQGLPYVMSVMLIKAVKCVCQFIYIVQMKNIVILTSPNMWHLIGIIVVL